MNIFIGCSSSNDIDKKYLELTNDLTNQLAKLNISLVFGAGTTSMMGICAKNFENQSITSVTVNEYIECLKSINSNKEYIKENNFQRAEKIYYESDIYLFLPGGIGTFTEIFSILDQIRTNALNKEIIIYNEFNYFDKLIDLINYSIEEKFTSQEITNYIKIFNDRNKLIQYIKEKQNERN